MPTVEFFIDIIGTVEPVLEITDSRVSFQITGTVEVILKVNPKFTILN